jgi:hypothetical protein
MMRSCSEDNKTGSGVPHDTLLSLPDSGLFWTFRPKQYLTLPLLLVHIDIALKI